MLADLKQSLVIITLTYIVPTVYQHHVYWDLWYVDRTQYSTATTGPNEPSGPASIFVNTFLSYLSISSWRLNDVISV